MATADQEIRIPERVREQVSAMRRRQWRARFVEGALIALAAVCSALLLALAFDWALAPRLALIRVVVSVAAIGVMLYACVRFGLSRIQERRRLTDASQSIEEAVPALQERWTTVIELAESEDPAPLRGAPALEQQVRAEADALVGAVETRQIAVPSRMPLWSAAAAFSTALLLLFLFSVDGSGLLLRRFVAPLTPLPLTQLSVPGDQVVALGDRVELQAGLSGRLPRRATLELRAADQAGESDEKISLTRIDDPAPHVAFNVASLDRSLRYRFSAGDGMTPWHTITAIERPAITAVSFEISPPAYSKLAAETQDALPGTCRALSGSHLQLAIQASKPLEKLDLVYADKKTVSLSPDAQGWFRFDTPLTESFTFSPVLKDTFGLENANPPTCRVAVYNDLPPSVEILTPQSGDRVAPDATLKMDVAAKDDFGVASARIVVKIEHKDGSQLEKAIDVDLGDKAGAREIRKQLELDLKPFQLQQGDRLEASLEVSDTRDSTASTAMVSPADPKSAQSKSTEQNPSDPKDNPAEQSELAGATPPNPAAGNPAEAQPSEKPDSKGTPPPSNPMEKRLAFGPLTACSNTVSLEVDQWAGDFNGELRKKLSLEIDRYLAEIKASLGSAGQTVDGAIRSASPAAWSEPQRGAAQSARGNVVKAEATIAEVAQKSEGSPYLYVGLHLKDLEQLHVTPADVRLGQAADTNQPDTNKYQDMNQASFHIRMALEKLDAVTQAHEMAKKSDEFRQNMIKFTKAYQVFVEDMYQFLQAGKPSLNPRSPIAGAEADEEFAKALEARAEKIKELLRQLGELMSQDENLRRRMMAMMELQGTTLRDQLTLLRQRQEQSKNRLDRWLASNPINRPAVEKALLGERFAEKKELASMAGKLSENYETWKPKALSKAADPVARGGELSMAVATADSALARDVDAAPLGQSLAGNDEIVRQLDQLQTSLAEALASGDASPQLPHFVANRIEETRALHQREQGWSHQVASLRDGRAPAAETPDLQRLSADTQTLGAKLESVGNMFGASVPEAALKAAQISELLNKSIPARQREIADAINNDNTEAAALAQVAALNQFVLAEKTMDEMLTLVEQAAANAPPPTAAGLCPVPDLETLLKLLENEGKACEKLGAACRLLNVQMNVDWFKPGSNNSGGQGGMGATNQRPHRAFAEAVLRAVTHPDEAALDPVIGADQKPGGRQWDTLASKLEDELNQERGTNPPEAYRRPIDQYFRSLAQRAADNK